MFAMFSPLIYLTNLKSGAEWIIYLLTYGLAIVVWQVLKSRLPKGEKRPAMLDFRPQGARRAELIAREK